MTAPIVNAAPMTRMLGTQDKSTRALVPEAEALPTHLPKVYIYAKKGPTTPQLVSGGDRSAMYGEDSFDLRKPWATHATVLSNLLTAQGNAQMIERVKPDDAAPPATIRIWADVLPCQLPVYQRNSDGSKKVDDNGNPMVVAGETVDGFKLKWVIDSVDLDVDGNSTFGQATQRPGDQVDGVTQSVRFPFKDLEVSSFGNWGNHTGLRMWAPTTKSSLPLDDRLLSSRQVYPYRMACVSRIDGNTSPTITETEYAEQYVDVCLKPGIIDPNTDALVYAGDVFIDAYQDLSTPGFPSKWGPFGRMHVYDDQIQTLIEQFYAAELPYIDSFSDFTGAAGEEYLFNIFSGVSSNNVPYHAFEVVTGAVNSVRFTENTTVYAQGGSDGTMNETAFAKLVATAVAEYADENSVLQDTAKYPESILYDSGFPLETKYALCSFIALRKDTAVVLSVHDVNGPTLTASQESAMAVALRTRLQMYPESEYFGTSTMRGVIVGRSGILLNSQYRKRLPLTMEIAVKAAKYMGASTGKWKPGFSFDMDPNSRVTMFADVNVTFTPAKVRNKDWAAGLVWVENFDLKSQYFPAMKTVYDNDTSVLNSFFTMMACVELNKIGDRTRRKFSGVDHLTDAQVIERVNADVEEQATGKFDGRYVIKPDAYYTAADKARGYSWTLPIKIYAPSMKTVGTLSIESYRLEDLQQ